MAREYEESVVSRGPREVEHCEQGKQGVQIDHELVQDQDSCGDGEETGNGDADDMNKEIESDDEVRVDESPACGIEDKQ